LCQKGSYNPWIAVIAAKGRECFLQPTIDAVSRQLALQELSTDLDETQRIGSGFEEWGFDWRVIRFDFRSDWLVAWWGWLIQ
jgi:hypothetical protein